MSQMCQDDVAVFGGHVGGSSKEIEGDCEVDFVKFWRSLGKEFVGLCLTCSSCRRLKNKKRRV